MNKNGFTLMELLIVLAILVFLSAVTFTVFSTKLSNASVEKEAEVSLSYIAKARAQTVASQDNSSFGIKVASSSIVFFKGTSFASGTDKITYALLSSVASSSLSGGATEFYFNRITGAPSASGTITLTSRKVASTTKTILIQATGLAEIQ